jgi:outer membrane usher protein FimD/PapC
MPGALLSLSTNLYGRISQRSSMSIGYTFLYDYAATVPMTHQVSASYGRNLYGGGNLNFSGRVSFSASGAPTFTGIVSLSIVPREAVPRYVNFMQALDGSMNINISDKLSAFGTVFDTNFSATDLLPGSKNDSSAYFGIQNSTNYFETSVNGSMNYSKNTNEYSFGGNLQLRTTLAFVNNHIAFTRQIPDSFLLITASPELKNQTLLYKLNTGAQYRVTHGRNIVIPLLSDDTAILSTDLEQAPFNFAPRYPYATISPAFKSGILFKIEIVRRYMINGRLVDEKGKPIEYLAGDVYDLSGSIVTSTFTDETGKFEIYDILPGNYRIQWPEGYGTTLFELQETDQESIDVGEIKIHIETK